MNSHPPSDDEECLFEIFLDILAVGHRTVQDAHIPIDNVLGDRPGGDGWGAHGSKCKHNNDQYQTSCRSAVERFRECSINS